VIHLFITTCTQHCIHLHSCTCLHTTSAFICTLLHTSTYNICIHLQTLTHVCMQHLHSASACYVHRLHVCIILFLHRCLANNACIQTLSPCIYVLQYTHMQYWSWYAITAIQIYSQLQTAHITMQTFSECTIIMCIHHWNDAGRNKSGLYSRKRWLRYYLAHPSHCVSTSTLVEVDDDSR